MLVCACQVDELADGVKAALVVHHQTILRNKRCAVAYLQSRLETRGAGAASLGTRLSFFKNPLSQTPLCFSGGGVTWARDRLTRLRLEAGLVLPDEIRSRFRVRSISIFGRARWTRTWTDLSKETCVCVFETRLKRPHLPPNHLEETPKRASWDDDDTDERKTTRGLSLSLSFLLFFSLESATTLAGANVSQHEVRSRRTSFVSRKNKKSRRVNPSLSLSSVKTLRVRRRRRSSATTTSSSPTTVEASARDSASLSLSLSLSLSNESMCRCARGFRESARSLEPRIASPSETPSAMVSYGKPHTDAARRATEPDTNLISTQLRQSQVSMDVESDLILSTRTDPPALFPFS